MPAFCSLKKRYLSILRYTITSPDEFHITSPSEDCVPSSRATRLVEDSTRFLFLKLKFKFPERDTKMWLEAAIKNGLTVDRGPDRSEIKYEFLGYSEGMLKEGRVIFFYEDEEWSVVGLKQHFGDLDQVFLKAGYGKYAARLGLSFSSTVETLDVPKEERLELSEIAAKDGSLCSDGCGMIRDSFARQICADLDIPLDTPAFQVRLGGIKGMLSRYPDRIFEKLCSAQSHCQGPKLAAIKIAYRPSMLKYTGGPTKLEVQNISLTDTPRVARLNVQFIILLMTLGISLEVFETLLKARLTELDDILVDRQKAISAVQGELDAEGEGFDQELFEMLLAGFDLDEPHLKSLLLQFKKRSLDSLRGKLHIPVKESAYAYGVVDELKLLEQDEVYWNGYAGDIVIAKNPAYSPRDVRTVKAVNIPELGHLKNCLVFPAKGSYSLPAQLSSGDLDGDQYWCCTSPHLIPSRKQMMDAKIEIEDKTSTQGPRRNLSEMSEAAVQTFVMIGNCFLLGSISNEWTARAPTSAALARDPVCMRLADLIERVLDMTKTGCNVKTLTFEFNRAKMPTRKRQGEWIGDWVNPIDGLRGMLPDLTNQSKQDRFECDPALVLEGSVPRDEWNSAMAKAKELMNDYNRGLMSAIILDKEIKESQTDHLKAWDSEGSAPKNTVLWRNDFLQAHFSMKNAYLEWNEMALKASAWYCTGYNHKKSAFAWLGLRWLAYLKCVSTHGIPPLSIGCVKVPLVRGMAEKTQMPLNQVYGINRTPERKRNKCEPEDDSPPARKSPRRSNEDDESCCSRLTRGAVKSHLSTPSSSQPKSTPKLKDDDGDVIMDDVAVPHASCSSVRSEAVKGLKRPVIVNYVESSLYSETEYCSEIIDLCDTDTESSSDSETTQPQQRYNSRARCEPASKRSRCRVASPVPHFVPIRRREPAPCTHKVVSNPEKPLVNIDTRNTDPKPRIPVATMVDPCISADGTHDWKIQANGTCRAYKCVITNCGTIVKERKHAERSYWITFDYICPRR